MLIRFETPKETKRKVMSKESAQEYYDSLVNKPDFTELTKTGIRSNLRNAMMFAEGFAKSKWISVKDKMPDYDDCGLQFLCSVKVCTHFQEYEIAEWFNPMIDITEDESKELESFEQPHFSIKVCYSGQQSLDRDVTH